MRAIADALRTTDLELLQASTVDRDDAVADHDEAEALLPDSDGDENNRVRPSAMDVDRFALGCLLMQHLSKSVKPRAPQEMS